MSGILQYDPLTHKLPEGSVDAWAQFNIITKVFTGVFPRTAAEPVGMNTTNYLYSPIEIDMATQVVVGTYDAFRVVNKADQPQDIHEAALDGQMRSKIAESYSNNDRLEILERSLLKLADAIGVQLPELEEVVDLVAEVKRTNELRKQSLAVDPEYNYISNAQALQNEMDQLEGGLHEEIGPRRTDYGVTVA